MELTELIIKVTAVLNILTVAILIGVLVIRLKREGS